MTKSVTERTVGLDLGDRYSYYVVVDEQGEVETKGRVATRERALDKLCKVLGSGRLVMEAGTHSGWVSRLMMAQGWEVLVANARQLPLIYQSQKKTDREDAEVLARIGRVDPQLLKPIRHREVQLQEDLMTLHSRESLIKARTMLINAVRGNLKQFGIRVGRCSAPAFARRVEGLIAERWKPSLQPLVAMIASLSQQIRAMDQRIKQLCEQRYPETGVLRQIRGVGPITALAFRLCCQSPDYFASNRDVGAYLGLVPKRDQSGERDRQLGITKAGNPMLRRLLVNCAQYQLGPLGMDSDIRRHGQRIAERGGKRARKRAVVAMARKLAVLMMCLWRTGQVYEPLFNSEPGQAA